jgi:hypothetical protein
MAAKAKHEEAKQDLADAIARVAKGNARMVEIKKHHNDEITAREGDRDHAVSELGKRQHEVVVAKGKMDDASASLKTSQGLQEVALKAQQAEQANIDAKMVIVKKQQERAHHWNRILKKSNEEYTNKQIMEINEGGCANGNCKAYDPNGERVEFHNVYTPKPKAAAPAAADK